MRQTGKEREAFASWTGEARQGRRRRQLLGPEGGRHVGFPAEAVAQPPAGGREQRSISENATVRVKLCDEASPAAEPPRDARARAGRDCWSVSARAAPAAAARRCRHTRWDTSCSLYLPSTVNVLSALELR
jgi:hypothetical protein